jgi:hypothetical protein
MEINVVIPRAIPALISKGKEMIELARIEELEIDDGKWNWGEFISDLGLGIGFAVCLSSGNVLGVIATGSAMAAQLYDSKPWILSASRLSKNF